MDSPISLVYPNGRVHDGVLSAADALAPGSQFDLYGRRWNAVSLIKLSRGRDRGQPLRMLCRSTADFRRP